MQSERLLNEHVFGFGVLSKAVLLQRDLYFMHTQVNMSMHEIKGRFRFGNVALCADS